MSSKNAHSTLMAGLQRRDNTLLIDPQLASLGVSIRKSQNVLSREKIYEIPVDRIEMNPFQTRSEESLDNSDLEGLAQSIAKYGLRTPIQLRRKGEALVLVAGWRRLTAIKRYLKSMSSVKATIDEEMDDKAHRVITLIENEQREDLTVFERAIAYQDLMDKEGYTQQQVADLVGSSKSRISRICKVLGLPNDLRQTLTAAQYKGLSAGHVDELVAGYFRREERGEDAGAWVNGILPKIMEGDISIEDLRDSNREAAAASNTEKASSRKPVKKWIIDGDSWEKFEVSTRNRVTLEFRLPEHIQFNDTSKIVRYIKGELLKSAAISNGKSSG